MPMIASYGGGWWIYGEKSGVKRCPVIIRVDFMPQNGATRVLVSSRKSGTVPPRNNRIRKAQKTGETKCALGGSVCIHGKE